MTPPQNHPPSKADVEQLTLLTAQLKGYGKREMTEVMRVLVMSVRDFMDEWFESTELKGLLGSAAIRGINQGPFAGNTVYTLLHHLAQGDGFFRVHCKRWSRIDQSSVVQSCDCLRCRSKNQDRSTQDKRD